MKLTSHQAGAAFPIFFLNALIHWLENSGYQRSELLASTDLDTASIENPETLLTLRQHKQIILNAIKLTDNPHLGLFFGQQVKITSLGIVGYAAISSKDLLSGLKTLVRYCKLRAPLFEMMMIENPLEVHVVIDEAADFGEIRQFMFEGLLALAGNMFQIIDCTGSPKARVKLVMPEPNSWGEYLHMVSFPVEFSQTHNEFILSTEFLAQNSSLADVITEKNTKQQCDIALQALYEKNSIVRRIESLIDEAPLKSLKLDEVASELCVSPRTLRRELQKLDTTYQKVLDNRRMKLTISLLHNTQLSISVIAEKMGYNDTANFGRAFKKWTGKSPNQYRR